MIYLISDPHSDANFNGLNKFLSIAEKDDLLIILGDIELNFYNTSENCKFTNDFLSIDKNIAFIDGNHDNHPFLKSFPIEDWNGGKVHRLSKNIVHLMRGNIYTLENEKYFVMGGCKSSEKWYENGLVYEGEIPSENEISFAYKNLDCNNNIVDYVLTHKYMNYQEEYPKFSIEELTKYIDNNVKYKKWYSGHWHKNQQIDKKHYVIYDTLTKI